MPCEELPVQIQVLLFGTFWDSFSPNYLCPMVDSIDAQTADKEG